MVPTEDRTTLEKEDSVPEARQGIGAMIFHIKGDHWDGARIAINKVQPIMFLSR